MSCCGVTRLERVKSEEWNWRVGVKIKRSGRVFKLEQNKLKWFKFVERMHDERQKMWTCRIWIVVWKDGVYAQNGWIESKTRIALVHWRREMKRWNIRKYIVGKNVHITIGGTKEKCLTKHSTNANKNAHRPPKLRETLRHWV